MRKKREDIPRDIPEHHGERPDMEIQMIDYGGSE